MRTRFAWSALRGACRRKLGAGLVLLALATAYGIYAGRQFGTRGVDDHVFDQPLVRAAHAMTPAPRHLGTISPENSRELYLVTVIADQQDVAFGLTLLILRAIVVLTVGGLGMVLLTAGSTEWEIRSETA
jgi:hypothetical protein